MTTTQTQIRITETEAPSRSKGRGWARIGGGDTATFATATGRTVEAEVGTEVTVFVGADLRRASGRTDRARDSVQVVVTGDEADTVAVSCGSPQAYTAVVTGVRAV